MAKEEILKRSVDGRHLARHYTDDIEFSPEDASRTEPEFLAQVIEAVIKAGATTVNIPDTVGYATPDEFGELFRYLFSTVPNIDKAIISVHCHNDLVWPLPTRWPPSRPAPARSNARSTASENGPATARWKKS